MPFMKQKKKYILLTRTKTMVSRTIHLATGDSFTHVSVAFDGELESLCSFGRLKPFFPLPAGLVRESLDGGYFRRHQDVDCMLCAIAVSDAAYKAARDKAAAMLRHREDYLYSIRGLALCRLGIEESRPGHYFCSQFVSELLESTGEVMLPKPASLMRPQDVAELPGLRCLYRGEISGLQHGTGSFRGGSGLVGSAGLLYQ